MNYFRNLPLISYNNNVAVNLVSRAKISDNFKQNSDAYFPYRLEDGDRVDTIANAYYDNSGFAWLVWLSNEVVDPYFDLGVSNIDLLELITSKYGSLENAQRRIAFYRTNGRDDSTTITPAQYHSLPFNRQKYWMPRLDYLLNVKDYVRNTDQQTINTNKIVLITLTNVTGTFIVGEEVYRNQTNYGFVTGVDQRSVTIQHVVGSFPINSTITGKESTASGTVISEQTIVETLASTDSEYWEPVSFYQYEIELNELKRDIVLVGNIYKRDVERELRNSFNQ